ncbi:hypothetical protein AAHC03_013309 [Spirometra sp. Aus1]
MGTYKCTVRGNFDSKSVVAEQSTFVFVKRAEVMQTQVVDEGISITMMCNVTTEGIPNHASNLRYEWLNPNGTVVGNQWFLKISKIQVHESGVYVCNVAVDVGDVTQQASQATNIIVQQAGNITFPGLSGHSVEVVETGSVLQTCKAQTGSNATYTYHWLGPDGQQISDTNTLSIEYALRSKHPGIYTCVATPNELGHLQLRSFIYLAVIPLRFLITVLAEQPRIGGFTHRRVGVSLPPFPVYTTKEQFEYAWIAPDGRQLEGSPGSDMYVQLNSLQNFGVYTVRVRGLNSGYTHELQTDVILDTGDMERYSLSLSGPKGPLYVNTRVEFVCSVKPPSPKAYIRWLNAQNLPVVEDGRLLFERFQTENEGSYVCEAFLPNGQTLRQFLELRIGNDTDTGDGLGDRYVIYIVRYPPVFTYGDNVRLQCFVRPDPSNVDFVWYKDGRMVTKGHSLEIPNFRVEDVGRYRCLARIGGSTGSADSIITLPDGGGQDLEMRPHVVHTAAFQSFQIECLSRRPGVQPRVVFSNGADVSLDRQFQVTRPEPERVVVNVPNGLPAVYNGITIQCSPPTGQFQETRIFIRDSCPYSKISCRSGECVAEDSLCDQKKDCPDASDESEEYCSARLVLCPSRVVVKPGVSFQLTCRSTLHGSEPKTQFPLTRRPVEDDPRFSVSRPSPGVIVITAPYGLNLPDSGMLIECLIPNAGSRVAVITVTDTLTPPLTCSSDQFTCSDGGCIPLSFRCDGQSQCRDGSDELRCGEADQCASTEFRCSNGECIPFYFRCNSRPDCRDASDEVGCRGFCREGDFRCASGECARIQQRCDGQRDCLDGSDEINCAQCREGDFRCLSGDCYHPKQRCDGRRDCPDGSDEAYCPKCQDGDFRCGSGECIRPQQQCDDRRDCADGSDEMNCTKCQDGDFRCGSGECIRPQQQCDDRRDCVDGSDELNCIKCRDGDFRCGSGECIRPQQQCDDRRDCADGSDELNCAKCQDGDFRCGSGECIRPQQQCDDRRDCADGSDELDCVKCREGDFRCGSGECIRPQQQCDDRRDCADGSDELNCVKCRNGDFRCGSGECIRPHQQCDDRRDCADGSDELNCIKCLEGDFKCASGECIRPQQKCDGRRDCADGSDETDCVDCREGDIRCGSGECIRPQKQCDGRRDCRDGSDETNCVKCFDGDFHCRSGDCIRAYQQCDGRRDCPDGSDETNCGEGEVIISPGQIVKPAWAPFSFTCTTTRAAGRPTVVFADTRQPVDSDIRFTVTRPTDNSVVVVAPQGLSGNRNNVTIECFTSRETKQNIQIYIESPCAVGQFACRTGTCLPLAKLCDGTSDCPDSSDEGRTVCADFEVVITPGSIARRPRRQFEFTCTAPEGERPVITIVQDKTDIQYNPAFSVKRPKENVILVTAPYGLTEADDGIAFECSTSAGARKQIRVSIESSCQTGQNQCADGTCKPAGVFCDGKIDCQDGSDENKLLCPVTLIEEITIKPATIVEQPWRPFSFVCTGPPGSTPNLIDARKGTPLTSDRRFRVTRPQSYSIQATAPDGLLEMEKPMLVYCYISTGKQKEIQISIEQMCAIGQCRCREGPCLSKSQFCDGRRDCPDGSDENPLFCGDFGQDTGIILLPDRILTPPWRSFDFYCTSPRGGQPAIYSLHDGQPLEMDRRFRVIRLNTTTIRVIALQGLRSSEEAKNFVCINARGDRREVVVVVDRTCPQAAEVGVVVTPDTIDTSPWVPFSFLCIASPNSGPRLIFAQGKRPIEGDSRFQVVRLNANILQVSAEDGLRSGDGTVIECVLNSGEKAQVTINVENPCPQTYAACRSGQCIPTSKFCDYHPDCADRSDEHPNFCAEAKPGIVISPSRIRLPAWTRFEFFCIHPEDQDIRLVFSQDNREVGEDSRFSVRKLNSTTTQISAPQGLRDIDDTSISCICITGEKQEISIVIDDACPAGYSKCREGSCRRKHQFCDGKADCPDRSDEYSDFCQGIVPFITVVPNRIVAWPWKSFEFTCVSLSPASLQFVFQDDGRPVDADARFQVLRLNDSAIRASSVFGLLDSDDMVIECVTSNGSRKEIEVVIENLCPSGYSRCKDGSCVRSSVFCDGKYDCTDQSDENAVFCTGIQKPIIVSPGNITTPPWVRFEFLCTAPRGGRVDVVFQRDGAPVQEDPRFRTEWVNETALRVTAPSGILGMEGSLVIECRISTGEKSNITITVTDPCPTGQWRCQNGECRPRSVFCNGVTDCTDGSDELPQFCKDVFQPSVTLIPGNITVPAWKQFRFLCVSRPGSQARLMHQDGRALDSDPRFRVVRLNNSAVEATAPQGLRDAGSLRIDCMTDDGSSQSVRITVTGACPRGQSQCQNGQCIHSSAFCDGNRDCSDGSDELSLFCGESFVPSIIIIPGSVTTLPWRNFQFLCLAPRGSLASVVFQLDGRPVENDARFRVVRFNESAVQVNAPSGLRGMDKVVIECTTVKGDQKEITVTVTDRCPSGYSQCRDGECIKSAEFCDGRVDCRDGSDEDVLFCKEAFEPSITIIPGRVVTVPWKSFEFVCTTQANSVANVVFQRDGRSIETDARFSITRYNDSAIKVTAPRGLRGMDDVVLVCVTSAGMRKEITVTVTEPCSSGYSQCRDGSCIPKSAFCDQRVDCRDGSDEMSEFCRDYFTPSITIIPGTITTVPWKDFKFVCVTPAGSLANVLFRNDGKPVDTDPRYEVVRLNQTAVQVTAPQGLRGMDTDILVCASSTGDKKEIVVTVVDACPPGYSQCRDGTCMPSSSFCDGQVDCRDRSDEDAQFCRTSTPTITIVPGSITTVPWKSFEFLCVSRAGTLATAVFQRDGRPVDADPRFRVVRLNDTAVRVTVPRGLRDIDDVALVCVTSTGAKKEIFVTVTETCTPGNSQCRDGACVPLSALCDGRADCRDHSDEDENFCRDYLTPSIVITPGSVTTVPWRPFEFTCVAQADSLASVIFQRDGRPVDADTRFKVVRINSTAVSVVAPEGLRGMDDVVLICVSAKGQRKEVVVTVEDNCQLGYSRCRDEACVPSTAFCDKKFDCPDQSDEHPTFCGGSVTGLTITPEYIIKPPWTPFKFTCTASPGIRPSLVFARTQKPVDLDPRFVVSRVADNTIEVTAPGGLLQMNTNEEIECVAATGERRRVNIEIENPCGEGYLSCQDGHCRPKDVFCDGRTDCADASDEYPEFCPGVLKDVIIEPGRIVRPPWTRFSFICTDRFGRQPTVVFTDSRLPVDGDSRFRVLRVNGSTIEVTAPRGLRGSKDSTKITCVSPESGFDSVEIVIEGKCGVGFLQCADGRCLAETRFCDGLSDCADGSDEEPVFCRDSKPGVVVIPETIQKPAWVSFSFVCLASGRQRPTVVFASSRLPVETDGRFQVTHLNATAVEVTVPTGLRGEDDSTVLECIVSGAGRRVTVTIEDNCGPGYMQCRDGRCRPTSDFCDGKPDCGDGSDEFDNYCQPGQPDLVVNPDRIHTRPWRPFAFTCTSLSGENLRLVFTSTGRAVEEDPRFSVRRVNVTTIEATAPEGLRELQAGEVIECVASSGAKRPVNIIVEDICGPGRQPCQDGTCLPTSQFCNERVDCGDGSDEFRTHCSKNTPGIIITPDRITTPPWRNFRFLCIAPSGSYPEAVFVADRKPVERDPRYSVRRINNTVLEVSTPDGLRSPSDSTQIECSTPTGDRKEISITVEDRCGPGRLPCRDGACLPSNVFCDGRRDCTDGSDELPNFCPELKPVPSGVRFSPSEQRVRPGQAVRLECTALKPDPRVRPIVEFGDGTPVEVDSQFRVDYVQPGRVVITLPQGSTVPWRRKSFRCYLPGGSNREAVVYIDKNCEIGQRRCDDGTCLFVGQFCDGKLDCPDGSDELPKNCDVCDVISKRCETVEGRPPKISYFQEHWRCDGEDDCGNGYDELNCKNYTRVPGMDCGGPTLPCPGARHLIIPIAYQCDGQADCPGGEDEVGCIRPTVLGEEQQQRKEVRRGGTLVLECEVLGVPPPVIVWRYNWGCLSDSSNGRARVEPVRGTRGCSASRSRLTITNFQEGDDGIYNCEGLSGVNRALSEDILVVLVD